MPPRRNRGFTLIELLVVIAIMALLMGILVPSFGSAMSLTRRLRCRTNLKGIVGAVVAFADRKQEHRGSGVSRALPVAPGIDANWSDPSNGNAKCMWILVERRYVQPELFLCPAMAELTAGNRSDGKFYRNTCGYSYLSMVGRGSKDILPVLTLANAPPGLIIVGDRNPRFNDLGARDSSVDNESNSKSHGKRGKKWVGQNVGRIDGSAAWLTQAKVNTGSRQDDWIYRSEDASGDTSGQAEDSEDVFLIP